MNDLWDGLFGGSLAGLPDHETAGTPFGGTALYRFFAVDSDLLYIGITGNLSQRWQEHLSSKGWYAEVHHMTVVWYRDRATALTAEHEAILDEMPRFNRAGNPSRCQSLRPTRRPRRRSTPEALKARAAYRRSIRAGRPLSDRKLGAMFGHGRTWGALRIREVGEGPRLAEAK